MLSLENIIKRHIKESADLKLKVLENKALLASIANITKVIAGCFQSDGKLLLCGNGGSAADAQHIASELSGRFYYNRPPLFAEALHVNTSYMTAVANDYGYEQVFARMTESMGRDGDVIIGLSTSGKSENVIRALETAQKKKMITIGMTGENPEKIGSICDHLISIPSNNTPRIQECHLLIGHAICDIVEQKIYPKP